MQKSRQDRIETVFGGGGQVVLLGAGASIASCKRNPEPHGKKLPSMLNFIEVVKLIDIVETLPEKIRSDNFEILYSNLHDKQKYIEQKIEIERRVYDYFKDMTLPDNEATIYDYLVLSLRPKDLIATFNWDPFLYHAFCRNSLFADMPRIAFLHGNVSIGFNRRSKNTGPAGYRHKKTYEYYEPTKLLYPVTHKNYNEDEFIKIEWDRVKFWINAESTKIFTVYGYSAPDTDVEAIDLLYESWGGNSRRNMEQFEIIDIKSEREVRKKWDGFIHSHHYDYSNNFFNSSLAYNPRRTSESYFQHILPMSPSEAFSESNPVPNDIKSLADLWEWHKPLIYFEEKWKKEHPDADL
jgi:hypothetical protein